MGKWGMVKLGDITTINMGQSPCSSSYNDKEIGLPFYQGNADFGELYPVRRYWCSMPKKIANKNDILISVRAPIGAINFASEVCCIGRGLAAITPKLNLVNSKFIFYILKLKHEYLNKQGTGSTFKAINKSVLTDLLVPLPSLAEQTRIAKNLDLASELIKLYKEQLAELDKLVQAVFYDMFGDPVTNEKGWELSKLSILGELNRGVSKHRPRNAPELLGGRYPLIQTSEISNAGLYITSYEKTYSELGLKQSRLWNAGTLCITIAANIAQTAILSFNACFPDSVVGFISNEQTNQIFIHVWFSFFQRILEEQAPQVAQKNINLQILGNLNVIVPPTYLQTRFAETVTAIEAQKSQVQSALQEAQALFNSLMQEYFE